MAERHSFHIQISAVILRLKGELPAEKQTVCEGAGAAYFAASSPGLFMMALMIVLDAICSTLESTQ